MLSGPLNQWYTKLLENTFIKGKVGGIDTSIGISYPLEPISTLITLSPFSLPLPDGGRYVLYDWVKEQAFPTKFKIPYQSGKQLVDWDPETRPEYARIIKEHRESDDGWVLQPESDSASQIYKYESDELIFTLEKVVRDLQVTISLNIPVPIHFEWDDGMMQIATILQYQQYRLVGSERIESKLKFREFVYTPVGESGEESAEGSAEES